MDLFEAIKRERTSGKIICGTVDDVTTPTALAAAFGLSDKPSCYRDSDADMARAIVTGILHRDLAYGTRLMSLSRAEELAAEFIKAFDKPRSRFFTNGQFKDDAGVGLVLAGWNPATTATFDTGVLVLAAPGSPSACLWIADED
jgi:hypothetical protein